MPRHLTSHILHEPNLKEHSQLNPGHKREKQGRKYRSVFNRCRLPCFPLLLKTTRDIDQAVARMQ